ncbi:MULTISPECIES: AlpA family phage regulatory protein [unclassified Xanthomonas]|uniref:helix-turn-helix transcriptional regulator n=1 Tax=unclassified Xanthomonas TaxID=2643310 RepID=UPI002A838ED5|nr:MULTISPECIES: AlpA family phage regulatory protein [unclassified Xanthomonas]MDY4296785.1 AlpA family phage regulatory protein [Xanthomonas sp. LF02-5]MDY4358456.1 AlpA family phage regulatory protein [Xanthomonas sp. LF04-12]
MAAAEKLEELCALARVRAMTGMGTTFIYGEIKDGRFPKPIRVGRRSLWVLSEVQRWVAQQITRNRPPQPGG